MLSVESRTEDNPYDFRHLLRKTSQRRKLIKRRFIFSILESFQTIGARLSDARLHCPAVGGEALTRVDGLSRSACVLTTRDDDGITRLLVSRRRQCGGQHRQSEPQYV
ncbi:hypothetical protein F2P81_019533 [Scophthalmus maximus]|uniref:Uncharacterized protein n=1 Tax=Scophthalmus maximus TaxID=52904 RepID=A0A6A4RZT3_SCOMX|nr:hypothetical protein F2P81_019533 [Scophthalmus maximus]